jgi:hypothetical protein
MSTTIGNGIVKSIGNDLVAELLGRKRFVLDGGTVQAEPCPNLIRLPAGHEEFVIDYHAVCRDSFGRIYVLYNSLQRFPHTRALARFHYVYDDEDATGRFIFDTFIGTRDWAEGTVHGLSIAKAKFAGYRDDDQTILLVNNDGSVLLAELDGKVRWRRTSPDDESMKPTAAVAAVDAGTIGLVDGYGTNRNYLCSYTTGEILGTTGGKGAGDGLSMTNHSVDLDLAEDFVVADRGNSRLTWWTTDTFEPLLVNGAQKQLALPGLQVCSVSFLGSRAVAACLNSRLAFLGPDPNHPSGLKVTAVIEMPPELIAAGIDGIHDAEFTADGRYLIVAVWERHRAERQNPTLTAFRLRWRDEDQDGDSHY